MAHIHKIKDTSQTETVIDSSYTFDGNIEDSSGEYAISLNGLATEAYETSEDRQAFSLADRSWLELPPSLHDDIQLDKSLTISLDFLYKDNGEDESVRVLLSNKTWAYDVFGLKIEAFNEKTEWQPEGVIFVQFNIGLGTQEIATRFFDIPMDEWHTATVTLDFGANTVTYGVNGRNVIRSLTESEGGGIADPTDFIHSLDETPFRIGVHQSNEGEEPEWRNEYDIENGNTTTSNLAEVLIDNFTVRSPKPAGDGVAVNAALSALTNHITGTNTLDDATIESNLENLRQNITGSNFSDFADAAKLFVAAHGETFGALYTIRYRNNLDNVYYDSLSDVSKAYVDLGVWMLEQGLTPQNASSAEGLIYLEHTEWPGALAENATRVTNATADIRAQYVRDPGYLMGGMRLEPDSELAAYLYRPTGFYAPAGETVTITVPEALVDSGVHIRVGAHADNHMILSSTSRFPLLSVDYRVESTSVELVNPFGGNIYLLIPQDTDLGWVQISVSDAVRAPYFSRREGYETPISEWQSIRQYPGVFTDLESDKFMITVPTAQLQNFDTPDTLLDRWDEIMDLMQTLHGRPFERSRAEAYLLDASQLVVGSFPGGYPVTPGLYAEGENGVVDGLYSPFAAINDDTVFVEGGLEVMLHELGHHHFGRFILEGEQESYVNVPAAAVFNEIYGISYDLALSYSGYQRFSRTDAATDWMITHNFRNGNPIGYDYTTENPTIETSYQARGHAKYVDLADIFDSWDALGDVYEVFYLEDLASGNPPDTQIGVEHDEFLTKGSAALDCNLASLFHFWGIHPTDTVASQLSEYPACEGALERVVHYLDNAPRTNEDLVQFHAEKTAIHENQLSAEVYNDLLATFDISYAQQIRNVGAEILQTYFDIAKDAAPSAPQISHSQFNFDTNTRNTVYFAWDESSDPEGKSLQYSFVLKRADTNEVVLSRSWIEGNGIAVSGDEFYAAISNELNSGQQIQLIQQVTTSDTFTIVESQTVATEYSLGIDSDADGLSDTEEDELGTDPYNPDSDGDGVSDGAEVYLTKTNPVPEDSAGGDNGSDQGGEGESDNSSGGDNTGGSTGSSNSGTTPINDTPSSSGSSSGSSGGALGYWISLLLTAAGIKRLRDH